MKISKTAALDYVTNTSYFYRTRSERNNVFVGDDIQSGTVIAVADDATIDPETVDPNLKIWSIERFNGANWVLESLDENYALTVTDEGLKALSDMQNGKYVFDISCIKVKSNNIANPSSPLTSWTDTTFIGQGDIVLSTSYDDSNFSLTNNKTLTWRNSLGNSGMQFTLTIDSDTYGYLNGNKIDEYTIGAIGLYVKDQRESNQVGDGILFAIGNLNEVIQKYTTTASRVGNAVKLYFNLVLSNLGHVANITSTPEDFHSIPEIATEDYLKNQTATYPSTVYPYNVYLIDNYQGTNAPALALRTASGTKTYTEAGVETFNWTWTYITPTDDTIQLNSTNFSPDCKNYMVVAWDSEQGIFVPADGDRISSTTSDSNTVTSVLTGIKIDDTVVFAGNIKNFLETYSYTAVLDLSHKGQNYRTGDVLHQNFENIPFFCSVGNVSDPNLSIDTISAVSPAGGPIEINSEPVYWECDRRRDWNPETYGGEKIAKIRIKSEPTAARNLIWNFDNSWLNKPLYADVGENAGKLTTEQTECFVGWCTGVGHGNSSIKLALDLRNEASDTEYGTTRYATDNEVADVANNSGPSTITSVTPSRLQQNYIQKTKIAGNPGESYSNPVVVESYVKFNETVIGKGVNAVPTTAQREDIAFYGLAYRAQWGDLAEYYESDKIYPAGTLITIGSGPKEITIATKECNGIISDKPGYELGDKKTPNHLPVALVGKVPVLFDKKCTPHFGDRVYLSRFEEGKASTESSGFCLGKIIDKRSDLSSCKTILCSIRISF